MKVSHLGSSKGTPTILVALMRDWVSDACVGISSVYQGFPSSYSGVAAEYVMPCISSAERVASSVVGAWGKVPSKSERDITFECPA